ncbi:MAG: hypothetical protein KDI62_01130 [Anaerolineae bacterium]|nr:hypothetical protein [Anaerolineae bacterium]MCB9108270.1 hypothetical protein [Anaerolineales bacterium]
METIKDGGTYRTIITDKDKKQLGKLIEVIGPRVEVEELGRYINLFDEEIWHHIVVQVCVMGSARFMERLEKNDDYKNFKKSVSLKVVTEEKEKAAYLTGIFEAFKATRFRNKAGQRLADILSSERVLYNGKIVLLKGLSHKDDFNAVRNELQKRCPIFKLKSASDFMISVGLSHDIIALDTRVVGVFNRYLNYETDPGKVQGNDKIYYSVETALREFCQEKNVTLALLDRLLFKYGNIDVIDFVLTDPH